MNTTWPHCHENPIYVFLFWELRGLSPNFHIHVSVSDLYILRIGSHFSCSRIRRSIVGIYKSLTDTWMWKLGLWLRNSFSENICFEFTLLVLCSAWWDNFVEIVVNRKFLYYTYRAKGTDSQEFNPHFIAKEHTDLFLYFISKGTRIIFLVLFFFLQGL